MMKYLEQFIEEKLKIKAATVFGIPCIDSLGVEGGGIHSIHEYGELASLGEAARRIAAVACGL